MISPKPISRQWPLRFRAIPIDSFFNGTTGIFRVSSHESLFVFVICPTVIEVFRLSISISFGFGGWTGSCFPVPKTSLKRVYFIVMFSVISGRIPFVDAMLPESESAFVRDGSSSVSIANEPPGVASLIWYSPFCIETIFDWTVLYSYWLCFL